MTELTMFDRAAKLAEAGIIVTIRDPRINTDFPGSLMVVEGGYEDAELPTCDASNGPWCIVGNDVYALVAAAWNYWNAMGAVL